MGTTTACSPFAMLALCCWSPDCITGPPSPQLFLPPPNCVSHCPILSDTVGALGTQCPAPRALHHLTAHSCCPGTGSHAQGGWRR